MLQASDENHREVDEKHRELEKNYGKRMKEKDDEIERLRLTHEKMAQDRSNLFFLIFFFVNLIC